MNPPPLETIEAACRAWWDATGPDGKRISAMSWDEIVARGNPFVEQYRRRMAAALQAAVGLP